MYIEKFDLLRSLLDRDFVKESIAIAVKEPHFRLIVGHPPMCLV